MSTVQRWNEDRAGCIFAGSSNRTADELNAVVVLLACDAGWTEHDGARLVAESVDGWISDADDAEYLSDFACRAQEWLNEHIAPDGYSFTFDDGFYLWSDDETDA